MAIVALLWAVAAWAPLVDLPEINVNTDNVLIRKSCRLLIDPDRIMEDRHGNGVIQIGGSDIVVEFAPASVLRGAQKGTRPDEF